MFDVGFTELLLLAIIGLLVLGPERLPKVARTLGGLSRKARSSWLNLKRSIDAEINAEEIRKPIKKAQDDFKSAIDGVDKKLKSATETVNSNLSGKTPESKAESKADSETADSKTSSNE